MQENEQFPGMESEELNFSALREHLENIQNELRSSWMHREADFADHKDEAAFLRSELTSLEDSFKVVVGIALYLTNKTQELEQGAAQAAQQRQDDEHRVQELAKRVQQLSQQLEHTQRKKQRLRYQVSELEEKSQLLDLQYKDALKDNEALYEEIQQMEEQKEEAKQRKNEFCLLQSKSLRLERTSQDLRGVVHFQTQDIDYLERRLEVTNSEIQVKAANQTQLQQSSTLLQTTLKEAESMCEQLRSENSLLQRKLSEVETQLAAGEQEIETLKQAYDLECKAKNFIEAEFQLHKESSITSATGRQDSDDSSCRSSMNIQTTTQNTEPVDTLYCLGIVDEEVEEELSGRVFHKKLDEIKGFVTATDMKSYRNPRLSMCRQEYVSHATKSTCQLFQEWARPRFARIQQNAQRETYMGVFF